MIFTVNKQISARSRSGAFQFGATVVNTPTFMPVATRGTVKGVPMDMVRSTGAGIVLGNTYHLHLAPGESTVLAHGRLRDFSTWNGPMLTDSGGFQVFSLDKLNKTTDDGVTFKNPKNGDKIFLSPEKSIQIQHDLGADIIMAFDDVVDLNPDSRTRTQEAFDRTHLWLERCIVEHKRLVAIGMRDGRYECFDAAPSLFGIVQGGLDKELRKKSLEIVQSLEVDGIAIGGLSVGESREEMHDMLSYLAEHYGDDGRPRYLMGVGHPIDMRFGIEHGIDMFDCVLPTRNGRHGTVWIGSDEQVSIKAERYKEDLGPLDESCECTTCTSGYTRAYLRHLTHVGEQLAGTLLSVHNLRYLQRICEEYQR